MSRPLEGAPGYTVSYMPDHSLDAGDGNSWVRPVIDCPNCPCCTLALCQSAHDRSTSCWAAGGGNHPGQHPLDNCPCKPVAGPAGARPPSPGEAKS
jgi:hypothetical protein